VCRSELGRRRADSLLWQTNISPAVCYAASPARTAAGFNSPVLSLCAGVDYGGIVSQRISSCIEGTSCMAFAQRQNLLVR